MFTMSTFAGISQVSDYTWEQSFILGHLKAS